MSKKEKQEKKGKTMVDKQNVNPNKLILLTEWNKYYNYPTLGALRSLVFNAKTNGFKKVIRRIGSRVLIKEDAFFEWVEEINGMTA